MTSWLYGVLDQSRSSHGTYSYRAAAIIKQGLKVMDVGTGWKEMSVPKSFMQVKKLGFQCHKNQRLAIRLQDLI